MILNSCFDRLIVKFQTLIKGYKLKCSIGKSGVKKTKKEGDLATPQGVFSLGHLYYRKDRNLPIKSIGKLLIILVYWSSDIMVMNIGAVH